MVKIKFLRRLTDAHSAQKSDRRTPKAAPSPGPRKPPTPTRPLPRPATAPASKARAGAAAARGDREEGPMGGTVLQPATYLRPTSASNARKEAIEAEHRPPVAAKKSEFHFNFSFFYFIFGMQFLLRNHGFILFFLGRTDTEIRCVPNGMNEAHVLHSSIRRKKKVVSVQKKYAYMKNRLNK